VTILAIALLICCSALFAGLTLGLMGLDKIGLQIVIDGGSKEMSSYAKKIQPLREKGNQLLCTLLIGNVSVNALSSILMADITSGLLGFFISTFVIVIFGEIVPQALCTRYALQIGSRVVPVVKFIMAVFYIFSKPLSMILDYALGDEIGTIHSRQELMKLLEIHVQHGSLDVEIGKVVEGALKFKDIKVFEVMTLIDDCFMLPMAGLLDFKTISLIFKSGFSRIPIYSEGKNHIEGVIFTKDLIFIDPEDSTPIENFMKIFGREMLAVFDDQKLGELLSMFKKGHSHIASVRKVNSDGPGDPFYEVVGIISLEDVLEEILGDEIVDETDVFVDMEDKSKVLRESEFDYAKLSLLDHRLGKEEEFGEQELRVMAHYLLDNISEFQGIMDDGNPLTEESLCLIIRHSEVVEKSIDSTKNTVDSSKEYIYTRGKPCSFCILILSGKINILAGEQKFRSDAGPWTVLAPKAIFLPEDSFVPDFSAFVFPQHKVKYVKISRSAARYGFQSAANRDLNTTDNPPKTHKPIFEFGHHRPFSASKSITGSPLERQPLVRERSLSDSDNEKGVELTNPNGVFESACI